jgi:hypothetical protein
VNPVAISPLNRLHTWRFCSENNITVKSSKDKSPGIQRASAFILQGGRRTGGANEHPSHVFGIPFSLALSVFCFSLFVPL